MSSAESIPPNLYDAIKALVPLEQDDVDDIIHLLVEIGKYPHNKESFTQELVQHYTEIHDPQSHSIIKMLYCLDQFYYCDNEKGKYIFSMIQDHCHLPASYIESARISLNYIHSHKKNLIEIFNSPALGSSETDFYKKLLIQLKNHHSPEAYSHVSTLLNYNGPLLIEHNLLKWIENCYLDFLNIMCEHSNYLGDEQKVIETIAKILVALPDTVSISEHQAVKHLLKVDINIIKQSICSSSLKKIIYEGSYKIFSQNSSTSETLLAFTKNETESSKKNLSTKNFHLLFENVFPEVKTLPERFGLVQLPELNVHLRERYNDRRHAWEVANNIVAYLLSSYHAITPLTLNSEELIQLITCIKHADDNFNIGLEHDTSLTPLAILSHSTDYRFLTLYYAENDREFENKIRALLPITDFIKLLPKPEVFKYNTLSNQTMELLLTPIERIIDRLILLRNTSNNYANDTAHEIMQTLVNRYCNNDYHSLNNVITSIKMIMSKVNDFRFNYNLKESKKIQFHPSLKEAIQEKINALSQSSDAHALQNMLNQISNANEYKETTKNTKSSLWKRSSRSAI